MTQLAMTNFKYMPEIAVITETNDLPVVGAELFRLKSINSINQYVAPLSYSVESIADVLIQHDFDGQKQPELDSSSLRTITDEDTFIQKDNPYAFIFSEYRMRANNNVGGIQSDYLSRLKFMVKELTTSRKFFQGREFTPKDNNAIRILAEAGLIDVNQLFVTGSKLPANVKQGLDDSIIGSFQRAFGGALNLVTGERKELANIDVSAGTMVALTELNLTVPVQAQAREVQIIISRDDDNDLYTIDPAAMRGTQISIPLYTPAYKQLKVEVLQVSGVHNAFKAYAGFETKNVGLFHKAKLQEFSPDFVPDTVTPTEEEERTIEELHLRELARVGATV